MNGKSKGKIQNFDFCLVVLSFTFLLLTCHPFFLTVVQACPGCKDALFDPGQLPQKLAIAKGYALSIGLLLAVPFALVGGLTLLIARMARRSKPPLKL